MNPSNWTAKQRGELAELKFDLAAASRNLGITRPHGDSLPFDRVIIARQLYRVQIKSTANRHHRCYQAPLMRAGIRPYQPGDFDILALLVDPPDAPEDVAWYIIPMSAIPKNQCSIHIHMPHSRTTGRFDHFRERWDLFE